MMLVLLAALAVAADSASLGVAPPEAAVVESAAPGDTSVRVPGTVVRLGWDHTRVSTLGSFRIGASNPGEVTREGELRWFGYPAKVDFTYRSGRLSHVRLSTTSASPRFIDFVPDELRRLGYRRTAAEGTPRNGISTWEGVAIVQLQIGSGVVTADVSPRTPPEPVAGKPVSGTPGDRATPGTPAVPPESPPLDFTAPGAESLAAPRLVSERPRPPRPRIAVDAGVFGRVLVRIHVGIDGRVERAEIERGIAELDQPALAWAGDLLYEPYLRDGRPVRFTLLVPVSFLPERPAAEGGKP